MKPGRGDTRPGGFAFHPGVQKKHNGYNILMCFDTPGNKDLRTYIMNIASGMRWYMSITLQNQAFQ